MSLVLDLAPQRDIGGLGENALVPALADLNKAAEIDPTNFYAYWNRGALRMAESDFASAQSDFTTALSLNPDPASKAKIEEVLNVATEVLKAPASTAEKSEPGVITDPSQFGGELEGSASASSGGLPADVTPGSSYAIEASPPPMAAEPVMPAAPSLAVTPTPAQ